MRMTRILTDTTIAYVKVNEMGVTLATNCDNDRFRVDTFPGTAYELYTAIKDALIMMTERSENLAWREEVEE